MLSQKKLQQSRNVRGKGTSLFLLFLVPAMPFHFPEDFLKSNLYKYSKLINPFYIKYF